MPNDQGKRTMFKAIRPLLVDARGISKSYMAIYSVMEKFSHRNPDSMIELLIHNARGILHDISTCSEVGSDEGEEGEEGEEDMHVLIQKGVRRDSVTAELGRKEKKMTAIISSSDLDCVTTPLGRALSGKVLDMDVSVIFEEAGVKLLQNGYRATRIGLFRGLRTSGVEKGLSDSGSLLSSEAISMLADLETKCYVCGPLMETRGVREEELMLEHFVVASTVTWVNMLAQSDVNVVSRARLETP